jgi:hypothetical protein
MVTGAYTPRNPTASPLYQCVQAHFAEFEATYPTRYQEQYGFYRPVIIEQSEVIAKILTHLGLWPARVHRPPAGYPLPDSLQRVAVAA